MSRQPVSKKEIEEIVCEILNKNLNKELIKNYITNINNQLFYLAKCVNIDIKELNYIGADFDSLKKSDFSSVDFEMNDNVKKDIISEIIKEEVIQEQTKQKIINQSLEAAGIKNSKISVQKSTGVPPPRTDWKRIEIDKDEKNKIIQSIRSNANSNIFSKNFTWEPEELMLAFKYLENSEKYSGPFIVSVVVDKSDLERYSKIEKISPKINSIFEGNFVILSVYDITAHNKESKYMYMGLNFDKMSGRLSFEFLDSTTGEIRNSQKTLAKEFLKSMDIIYDTYHEDLKNFYE